MPDHRGQVTSSIKCPALIDILSMLGAAKSAFFGVPEAGDDEVALELIQLAAIHAHKEEKAYTKEYVVSYLEMIEPRQAIVEHGFALIGDVEGIESFGELIVLIEWVCQRINKLTGCSTGDIRQTMERVALRKPLEFVYGETDSCLNDVAAKLRQLDSDGKAIVIWRRVLKDSSIIRDGYAAALNCRAEGEASKAHRESKTLGSGQTVELPAPEGGLTPPLDDGTIVEARIVLDGLRYNLTPNLRTLLNRILAQPKVLVSEVVKDLGMTDRGHFDKRLRDLRDRLQTEMKNAPRALSIVLDGEGMISHTWNERKTK